MKTDGTIRRTLPGKRGMLSLAFGVLGVSSLGGAFVIEFARSKLFYQHSDSLDRLAKRTKSLNCLTWFE